MADKLGDKPGDKLGPKAGDKEGGKLGDREEIAQNKLLADKWERRWETIWQKKAPR